MIKYLNGENKNHLTMSADDLKVIKWNVNAISAVYPDFKSHTGAIMTMGQGEMQSVSRKHKMNTWSSTESELFAVDDVSVYILWVVLFIE